MLKWIILGYFVIALTSVVLAQNRQVVNGRLTNKKTGEPVGFASIHILETDEWASSDGHGNFILAQPDTPYFTIEIRCLGFESVSNRFRTSDLLASEFAITMAPVSYDMEEITVLARNNNGITSSSVIGSGAIEHVQPVSLADVMQLLPGNIASNPNLSAVQKIVIREIVPDDNSSMGTAVIIDGAPVSNNANLQTYSTAKTGDNFTTVAGSGIDLRQIATDNIESVEFIKGIPSVTYGDLTSGAVIVRTKSGYAPWEAKLKTDALIKQLTLGKGLTLKSLRSSVNFNFDYLQSFDDLRSKYNGFNRLSAGLGFSKTFGSQHRPFTYNARFSWFETIDDAKTDPDAMVAGEQIRSKNRGVRFNMYGKWIPKLRLLTNLDYTFSVACEHQVSSEDRYRSSGGPQVVSTSMTEGEHPGIFLPSEQMTTYSIDGKPVNVFLQVTGKKVFRFYHGITNQLLYGFDYRLDANAGRGQVYDLSNPPFVSVYTSRPRSFRDIPALRNYALYLEDKMSAILGKTVLDIQAGLRWNNFQSAGLFRSDLGFYAEPRLNLQYSFLTKNNNLAFDQMAIRLGIGKTFKTPPLLYLFPDKAYFDLSALNYYTGNSQYNTSIIDTRIYETGNPELKPSENLKMEAALIFKVKKISGSVTAFREKLTNGFDFTSQYLFIDYTRYKTSEIPAGTKPDPSSLPQVAYTSPVSYRKPVNNQETLKSGIEYSFDFGKINAVYTSFTIDGAWLRTRHIYSTIPYQFQPAATSSTPYLYVGMYPEGESKIGERLNTNLRMVTQMPRLRLIVSTTLQMIWYDMYYYPRYDKVPDYLINSDGTTQSFTQEMIKDPKYYRFVDIKNPDYFQRESMPPLLQMNFRLSKEIYDKLKLSFYVNNFVNYRPEYEYKRSGSFIRRNPPVYFGAEVKIIL